MALAHYLLAELLHILFVGYATAECNGRVGGIALPERGAERQDWRQGIVAVAAPPVVPAFVMKATKTIKAADVPRKSYMETEEDIDDYLSQLRQQLLAAINSGHKARIQ